MRGFWKVNLYKSIPSCLEKKSATSNKIFKFPPVYFFHICFFSASACTVLHSIKKKKGKNVDKSLWNNMLTVKRNWKHVLFCFIYLLLCFLSFVKGYLSVNSRKRCNNKDCIDCINFGKDNWLPLDRIWAVLNRKWVTVTVNMYSRCLVNIHNLLACKKWIRQHWGVSRDPYTVSHSVPQWNFSWRTWVELLEEGFCGKIPIAWQD